MKRRTGRWAVVAISMFVSTSASAAQYSLMGNARYQIGDGLPTPIGFTPIPDGRVRAIFGATASQTGADPMVLKVPSGQLTAPVNPVVLNTFLGAATAVFQLMTAISVQWPLVGGATLSARVGGTPTGSPTVGGRTGAQNVQWCPGQTVPNTPAGNPGCAGPASGPGINGVIRYSGTVHQFGGSARANAQGSANRAFRVAAGPPCAAGPGGASNPACQVIFAVSPPPPTGLQGGPFNVSLMSSGPAPSNGRFYVSANVVGRILTIQTSIPLGPGLPTPVTSYGAPWTTGMIQISVTAARGFPEVFTLTGSDNRVNGVGIISLVSGAISDRSYHGPNANRGWLNLELRIPSATPTISSPGLVAVVALMALAGGYALRRQLARS